MMRTIIESPLFTKLWPDYWSVDEHGEFAAYIASSPEAGDLIPGSADAARSAGLDPALANAAA